MAEKHRSKIEVLITDHALLIVGRALAEGRFVIDSDVWSAPLRRAANMIISMVPNCSALRCEAHYIRLRDMGVMPTMVALRGEMAYRRPAWRAMEGKIFNADHPQVDTKGPQRTTKTG